MPRKISWFFSAFLLALLILGTLSSFAGSSSIDLSFILYLSQELFKVESTKEIFTQGTFGVVMIFGVFIGSLVSSIFYTKSFRISFIPKMWRDFKGDSIIKRAFVSFIGGFFLISSIFFTAQSFVTLIVSGANLSLVAPLFLLVVSITMLLVGKFFYKVKEEEISSDGF
jgi:uncharacterized membrane protein YciS (DUF1049 family)